MDWEGGWRRAHCGIGKEKALLSTSNLCQLENKIICFSIC